MNKQEINAFRAAHGLAPIVPTAKRKNTGNAAKRAQACRDIKALRNKGGK